MLAETQDKYYNVCETFLMQSNFKNYISVSVYAHRVHKMFCIKEYRRHVFVGRSRTLFSMVTDNLMFFVFFLYESITQITLYSSTCESCTENPTRCHPCIILYKSDHFVQQHL